VHPVKNAGRRDGKKEFKAFRNLGEKLRPACDCSLVYIIMGEDDSLRVSGGKREGSIVRAPGLTGLQGFTILQ